MGDSACQGLGIADCLCRDNMIVEEWKLRDRASFVQQLGMDPVERGLSLGKNNPEAYAIGNEAMRRPLFSKVFCAFLMAAILCPRRLS